LKIKYIFIKTKEILMGTLGFLKQGLLVNYCIEKNAGDMFNKEFIEQSLNKSISKYTFGARDHVLFCGSVLSRSNKHSILIGAGFISEETADFGVEFKELIGVRGKLSYGRLVAKNSKLTPKFIGDPGLLAREVIETDISSPPAEKIGLIPHFVDLDKAKKIIGGSDKYFLIDIRRPYVDVCHDIRKCKVVLSSSLHGLVFSDAMSVDNVWITFGEGIKGGVFKYLDYYSGMTNPREDWIFCKSLKDLEEAAIGAQVSENLMYEDMRREVFDFFEKF
jgi:pyruvyltransferase